MYYDNFLTSYAKKHGIEVSTEIKEALNGYNPRQLYANSNQNFEPISDNRHKIEVGRISNLIKRMSEANASMKELAKALRHLIVVLDGQKYFLDYKKSEQDHDIAELRKKYPYKPIVNET